MNKLVRVCFCVVGVVSLRKFLHRASLDQKVSMYGLLFSFAKLFSVRVTPFAFSGAVRENAFQHKLTCRAWC